MEREQGGKTMNERVIELKQQLTIAIEWLYDNDFTGEDLDVELHDLIMEYGNKGLSRSDMKDVLVEFDLEEAIA